MTQNMSLMRNATWALSNLCRGKPPPIWHQISPTLHILPQLLNSTDTQVLADACWALSYLSDGTNQIIQQVIDCGIAKRIIELMCHDFHTIQTPALRSVGNIVTGDDLQTQTMINYGVLGALKQLLKSPKPSIVKEAVWTISNITAGNRNQIQQVIDENLFFLLIDVILKHDDEVKKESLWAISNATINASPDQIQVLVSYGYIEHMCDMLTCNDTNAVIVTLEGLENILQAGDKDGMGNNPYISRFESCMGIDKLETLQNHLNMYIYLKSVHILESFFGATPLEELVLEDINKTENGIQYNF